ncbi:hypothetical protein R1flu_024413 [Riccia fluitans]|uniref:Endonuclease I n=1 Tax=Riccia fluitans TaxID=41844 RepID=A0ABD1XXR8_9MARC
MDRNFAATQRMRITHTPVCQDVAWVTFCNGRRYCPPLLRKTDGSVLGIEAYNCLSLAGVESSTTKRTLCSQRLLLQARLGGINWDRSNTGGMQFGRSEFEGQRWSSIGRATSGSCRFVRGAMQSHHQSSEEENPANTGKRNVVISATVPDSGGLLKTAQRFHIANVLETEVGLSSYDYKSWLRSVCSTLLALAICVPQALGVEAAFGDLALNTCESPEVDYAPLRGLQGIALKDKLHDLVKDHKVYTYLQAWEALKVLDEAKDDPNSVIDIYSLKKQPKSAQGKTTGWNREHLWPRSFGLIEGQPGFSDLHNLRPADTNVNSSRGNKAYGDCSTQAVQCIVPANKEAAPDTGTNKDIWMPPGEVRGDIARAVFYMAVRYGSEQPAGIKALSLSNSPDVGTEVMGLLKDLVRWNELDPPSDVERGRNNKVCSLYQHNRNPFVDHPEFVKAIWGDGSSPSPDTPDTPEPSPAQTDAWINELHYNNAGVDQNEFLEVITGQGVDPSTLKLVLYNSNGKQYRSLSVGKEFSKVELGGGFSLYVARLPNGTLQNGPADGLALVVSGGKVIQLLSYGGAFKAMDGPAEGQDSIDIGVQESEKTPVGSSLGLSGRGNKYGDFRWSVFTNGASPGALNSGQTLLSAPSPR